MKNNLADLNNHLFSTLEALEEDDIDDAKLDKLIKKAKAVSSISGQILKIASVQVAAMKAADSCGLMNKDMPALIAVKDSAEESAATSAAKRKLIGAAKK